MICVEDALSPLVRQPCAGDLPQTCNLRWFVVETTEGGGDKAQLALAFAGVPLWRPFDVKRDCSQGRKGKPRKDIKTPRFGRYFFIRCAMSDELRDAILNARGVATILCGCGTDNPAPVADDVIAWLRSPAATVDSVKDAPKRRDTVKVVEGPFAGMSGKVVNVDKKGVLHVELDVFGRLTPSIFQAGHVTITRHGAERRGYLAKTKHRAA